MAKEQIIIEFKPSGHPSLLSAIRSLDKATRSLLRTQAGLQDQIRGTTGAQKKFNVMSLFGIRNQRNMNTTVSKGAVAFSVFRSKLLLASFAMSLFGKSIGVAIKAMMRQEEAEKKLSAALKSTGNVTGVTSIKLKAMASDLQAITKFGDETIISAQALMLTFTKIGRDVFPEAIKATLNISEAMGQDLQQTVIQVGKALNDPVKGMSALSRVGIQLTKTQQKQIRDFARMNKVAEAQKIILQELEVQFGGMAVSATRTLTGALMQLKNSWGDLLERIGNEIAPLLGTIAESFKSVTMAMMTEQEKEIAILQGLGFTEELINERRKVMHRETMVNLQAQGSGLLATWGTIAQGEASLISLNAEYKNLNEDIKENQGLVEGDERAIRKLGVEWGLTRSEMEFMIDTTQAVSAGFGTFASHILANPLKAVLSLEETLKAMNNETFKSIVANRESGDAFKKQKDQVESFIVTLRALMELMGHEFPEVTVKATLTQKQMLQGAQLFSSQFSALTSTMKSDLQAREKAEIDALKNTDAYKRASSEKQKKMEEDKRKTFAKEKLKIWNQEKLLNISNVIMNTATAIMKAGSQLGAFAVPMQIALGAMGAWQLSIIQGQKPPKFAQGGMVGGRPHSQGGSIIEAERGEFVMSSSAVRNIGIETMNRINEGGGAGGVNINFSGNVLSQDFIENEAIPQIKEAIRRGADLGVA